MNGSKYFSANNLSSQRVFNDCVIYINTVLGTVQQNPQIQAEGGSVLDNIDDQTIIINGTKQNIKRPQGVSP
jgi:hypothetical protein